MSWAYVLPIMLLLCSNVFMTFAWYGQLRFPGVALWILIPVSWGIAFFEYCLAVPANRIGYTVYSGAQLNSPLTKSSHLEKDTLYCMTNENWHTACGTA